MKRLSGDEIRRHFLEYFRRQDHRIVRSSSLIPQNDPTLLFTNAGMVQFKDVFIGANELPFRRAASCQKCVRAGGKHNDLENVGRTRRHHTFFEMLGNFSFGDYFKERAIEYCWDLLVNQFGFSEERLYATVFEEDDEAFLLWQKVAGLPEERIYRLGEKDNFWAMGETGPCGPCSEIVIDQGKDVGCQSPECGIGCDCDRFLELWNLVFMQYERSADGRVRPLPRPSIDTGAGLERLAAVMQGVKSNFECDLLFPLIVRTEELAERKYGEDPSADVSLRVIADHARAVTFLLADGVTPSNESRGYVLRRILRRALRHGMMLGLGRPFLYQLVGTVVDIMAGAYPELEEKRETISRLTRHEEERFMHTLRNGLPLAEEELRRSREKGEIVLPGDKVFRLYDTYGVPFDLLSEMAREMGISLDEDGFQKEMEEQRRRSRASGFLEAPLGVSKIEGSGHPATQFIGYETLQGEGTVRALLRNGESVEEVEAPAEVEIILDRTPFYAESGGQVGDRGWIIWEGGKAEVLDTTSRARGVILHRCRIKRGKIHREEKVWCRVDEELRQSTACHHTATHILHAVLRQVLGDHVRQSGSLVAPDRLRFDFSHFSPLQERECERIEELANEYIRSNLVLQIEERPLEEALASGAVAIFGERYGEIVRVVTIPGVSRELCGGTHVRATGELGILKLIGEEGVAAGIRRIEAVAGREGWKRIKEEEGLIQSAAERLKAKPSELLARLDKLMHSLKEQEAALNRVQEYIALQKREELLRSRVVIEGVEVVWGRVDFLGPRELRRLSDLIRDKMQEGTVVLASSIDDRVHWLVSSRGSAASRVHAGKLVREVAEITDGKGGGRAELAEGSGRDPGKIDQALASVPVLVKRMLGERQGNAGNDDVR